mgnify:FL=1
MLLMRRESNLAKFELIKKFQGENDLLPKRKTVESAGYDFIVAKDTIILPYHYHFSNMSQGVFEKLISKKLDEKYLERPMTLDEVAAITKETLSKPTLVPTGVKVKLDPGTYLELSVRSSCPLKYWLIMANSVGIIDGDYYNNPDNEGHIFFQMINFSPVPIILKKGDCIGQGIIKPYLKTEDDNTVDLREGGFGSTDAASQPVLQEA